MRLSVYLMAFVALLPLAPVRAATPNTAVAQEARALTDHLVSANAPGIVVLIAKGNQVVYRGARGSANIELGVPLKAADEFRIASITKTFTAAMILKLAEEGKLSLDDSLAKYFQAFPNGANITIRELLSHTAGIPDVGENPQPGFVRRTTDMKTQVATIAGGAPDFSPGTSWSYSNAGFILLGAIIEQVTGRPWYVAIEEQLLRPLRLDHTRYGVNEALIPGRVAGYSTDPETDMVINTAIVNVAGAASAGALISTVDDLARWIRALATGRFISAKSFAQMITPTPNLPRGPSGYQYGFGMYLWQVRGSEMIGHTGQIDGFTSAVGYLPKQDTTVVVLANDDNFDARTALMRFAAIALGHPYGDVVAVHPSAELLQAIVGTYRIDGTQVETLSVKGNTIYARRSNRNAIPLQVTADGQMHFVPDELTYIVPVRDATARIVGLDYFPNGSGPPITFPRI